MKAPIALSPAMVVCGGLFFNSQDVCVNRFFVAERYY